MILNNMGLFQKERPLDSEPQQEVLAYLSYSRLSGHLRTVRYVREHSLQNLKDCFLGYGLGEISNFVLFSITDLGENGRAFIRVSAASPIGKSLPDLCALVRLQS